jgi:hypothetical protein
MAYQLDRYNGTFLVNVEDGSIETNATDLRFVGKNYAGYGELQNENFLHLLENFANNTAPPKAIVGQLWYDSGTRKLKYYNGNKFKITNGAEIGIVAPTGLEPGEFWFDTSSRQLYAWTGQDFVLIGPETGPELGAAGVTSQVVKELDTGNSFTILRLLAGGKTIGVISQDEFILDESQTPIEDFFLPEGLRRIKKGFNLTKTNVLGVTSNDFVFWGTAANSQRLGGVDADQYLRAGNLDFNNEASFADVGFQLGDQNDVRLRVENNDQVIFENRLGNPITFRITVGPSDIRDVAIINRNGIEPRDTATFNLGRTGARWNEIYGTSIFGNLTGNVTGDTVGAHRGNLLANDSIIMINAATKTIGFAGCRIEGTLFGNITGSAESADDASRLGGIAPSAELPTISDKTSIPVRTSAGNIKATRLEGVSDQADELLVVDLDLGTYVRAKVVAEANTVVSRDSGANINAVLFQGTATSARYADLAEKYLADKEYEIGTVVMVGGEAEVTACSSGERALGVVSANPAYMMNSELVGGTYIALKGRVPVKIIGTIKKGDRLVGIDQGVAIKSTPEQNAEVFAIALESSDETGAKLIEAVVL